MTEHTIDSAIVEKYVDRIYAYAVKRSFNEDEAADLLKEIQKQLKKRQWGEVIRLEVEEKVDKRLLKLLRKELAIKEEAIYGINGPLDLTFLMKMYGLEGFNHLKTPKFTPQPVPALPAGCRIFDEIRKGDILLHHPYQTFEPVVDFIRQAAKDPEVLAMAPRFLVIQVFMFLSFALMSPPLGFITGIGNAKLNFIIAVADGVVARIGLGLFLAITCGMGLYGYWWGSALAGFVSVIAGWIYYFSGRWKNRQILVG